MTEEFRHDRDAGRFEVWVAGEFAGEATYLLRGNVAVFDHTWVEPQRRHTGLASRLVQFGFDEVRREGEWLIRPQCPYVVDWAARHQEYGDLVA
ncbi:MAG: GNAT family N-acetyltransferase [Propionicimonas sp.]|nr:GNAT family N-acetyltransferase [Propionicimonas sp.]